MAYDYVFGFGSIINTDTHAPWVSGIRTGSKALQGQKSFIRSRCGYCRGWNFRSNTGFTALGVTKDEREATDINGVLFRIPHSMLECFDRREVGYDRAELNPGDYELIPPTEGKECNHRNAAVLNIQSNEKVWLYVPQSSFCVEADENHPILQSYVDTVMQGCLEWGGEGMASSFVATTSSWSPFFLNDTPSSRRPWLFRKEYNTIDKILSRNPATHFADRRHPEEFASHHLKMMRGTWSVPRRNTVFTGRQDELDQVHSRLTTRYQTSIATLQVAGMGGVGKTHLCIEYCYRYYPSYYGLVIWLSAQSAESIAASYRQLMSDTTGTDVQDSDVDEVVSEVKARLYRCKTPWLLVFDNLEDRSLLKKFVPHGGGSGHVLITTRLIDTDLGDQTMMLGCFNPSESVELLCRSANISGEVHMSAATKLANQLGHLPLALHMAGSYMQRCDVSCSEYLARYVESDTSGVLLGRQAVASSLNMSLNAIKKENISAWEILRLLGWLGPDQITKALMRSLLRAKEARTKIDAELEAQAKETLAYSNVMHITTNFLVGSLALFSFVMIKKRQVGTVQAVSAFAVASLSVTATLSISSKRCKGRTSVENRELERNANTLSTRPVRFSANEFEQTDQIWNILKSFSLVVVKDSKGSMHRLLAQALRVSQNEKDSYRNLEICTAAVQSLWTFKPEQVDSWQNSASILEHVKAVVLHAFEQRSEHNGSATMDITLATLSREAAVFTAMALNRFEEAQFSLEQSLKMLDATEASTDRTKARATTLHELGRNFRYLGDFQKSQDALQEALEIRNRLATSDLKARQEVASTLHEIGVLEVKKRNLDSATYFLQKALELRYNIGPFIDVDIEAQCAATLHELAAVQVARKPPLLDKAWGMLQEALGLNMQIGQRAATLKQLARVAIRRGEFDSAEKSLSQALELYVELYGENTLHINVAAVKFQQGALAFQREQLEHAWIHFSECLQARRNVYAYSQGNHLEVSSTLHHLGRVAYSQNRTEKAIELLHAEKEILDQLCETSTQRQRMLQARLTNLTWLRKCAKETGDDEEARKITVELTHLKTTEKDLNTRTNTSVQPLALQLQQELVRCRLLAREYALACLKGRNPDGKQLRHYLASVYREIEKSPPCAMKSAACDFHKLISEALSDPKKYSSMLNTCDVLRVVLREHGVQVVDVVQSRML